MAKSLLDKVYRVLIIISIILGITFGVFVVGHTGYLMYEYLAHPEKSKERWHQIEHKFQREPKQKATAYYSRPTTEQHTSQYQ
jgi:hypothetical protein